MSLRNHGLLAAAGVVLALATACGADGPAAGTAATTSC
jgi:hypothetical protein